MDKRKEFTKDVTDTSFLQKGQEVLYNGDIWQVERVYNAEEVLCSLPGEENQVLVRRYIRVRETAVMPQTLPSWDGEARCPSCLGNTLDYGPLKVREGVGVEYPYTCTHCRFSATEVFQCGYLGTEIKTEEEL